MRLLREAVLPRILLRRTKLGCAGDLALPPRTVVLRKARFLGAGWVGGWVGGAARYARLHLLLPQHSRPQNP